jgi:HK97 family phage major capsid protein
MEDETVDYSYPKFRQLNMDLYKLVALYVATQELAEDAKAFDAIMTAGSQKGLNYMLEDAFINGTGAGQPQGFLNSACKVTIAKEAGQNASTIVSANIFKMLERAIPESWTNGDLVFIGHPSTIPQVSTLGEAIGTGGSINPLWHWRQGGERHNKLCGLDYLINDRCQTVGTEGDIFLVDLKSVIATYRPAKTQTSIHISGLWETDQELMRFIMRLNIQNILAQPITPAKGSDSLSTVVVLGPRS